MENMTVTNTTNNQPLTFVGGVTTVKRAHGELILDAVCTNCGHCGLALTDSVSVQRGIGPSCSKKGYSEDPVDGDEVQALISLAEYPELVEFLTEHYKPQGVRGLVNGLVRICSLNRKSPVHAACTEAIDALGYKRMASLLRESLAIAEVKVDKAYPDYLHVWVKKSAWSYSWTRELNAIYGTKRHPIKGTLVLNAGGRAFTEVNGEKVLNKVLLWDSLIRNYDGHVVKTDKGAFRIKKGEPRAVSA